MIRTLLVLSLAAASLGAAASGVDPWWKKHIATLEADGQVWRTSNALYRRDHPAEPPAYLMRYHHQLGKTAVSGCLWGEMADSGPMHFWDFFLAWHPADSQVTVWQSSADGTVGAGTEWATATAGISEMVQVFTRPDGTSWKLRHLTTVIHRDTIRTESFNWKDGAWTTDRTYTWIRTPAPPGSPC